MSKLDQRLQVLIDERRLRRVNEAAANEGLSVGEWVRRAIDSRFDPDDRAEMIRAFMDYASSVAPLLDDDLDSVAAVREARDSRVNRLLELYPEGDGDDRSA